MKIHIYIILFFLGAGFTSCDRSNDRGEIDFTKKEIVELVKLNFIEDYGGIEKERSLIFELGNEMGIDCDVDTILVKSIDTLISLDLYELNEIGTLRYKCRDHFQIENNHFISFDSHTSHSEGTVSSDIFSISFEAWTSISISGVQENNAYSYDSTNLRSFNLVEGNRKGQDILGTINFNNTNCYFDFSSNQLFDGSSYAFRILLSDNNDSTFSEKLEYKGKIEKSNKTWILTFRDGDSYFL